jgi:polyhydroxyalkanoate synthesis regulator phasin
MTNNHDIVARVEFRWRQHEEEFAKLLSDSARKAGRCTSDHARELMKDALTANEQLQQHVFALHKDIAQALNQLQQLSEIKEGVRKLSNTNDGIRTLHDNIYGLRDELASYVVKILCDAGKMQATEARKWMDKISGSDQSTSR